MGDREKASLRLQFNPQIRLELHGATITSDAGLLAFRELDDALDLTPIAYDYLQESRTGRNIRHHLVPLLSFESGRSVKPGQWLSGQTSRPTGSCWLMGGLKAKANRPPELTHHPTRRKCEFPV